jgi:uncharacterized protein
MTPPQETPPAEEPRPQPKPYPFWGYRDVFLLATLAFILLVVIGTAAHAVYPRTNAVQAIAVTFLFEGLWFAILYAVIHAGYGRPFWSSLGWFPPPGGVARCILFGVVAAVVTVLLGSMLPRPHGRTLMEELLQDRASILMLGFFATTLGPLFEELAFRGFLMPLLVKSFGAVGGVLLQALPFALLHGFDYSWSWQQLILLFLAGTAFGWMRLKTGSTAASTYMHAGYNFTAFVGIFAQSFSK